MAKLVGTGVNPDELTPISTQLELLYQYWSHQVIRSDRDQYGGTREDVLRKACERMVAERVLYVERQAVAGTDTNPLLDDLLSTQILTEWQSSPKRNQKGISWRLHTMFSSITRLQDCYCKALLKR